MSELDILNILHIGVDDWELSTECCDRLPVHHRMSSHITYLLLCLCLDWSQLSDAPSMIHFTLLLNGTPP